MIKVAAFDLDETLFDTDHDIDRGQEAQYQALRDQGYRFNYDTYVELVEQTVERFRDKYQGDPAGNDYGNFMQLLFQVGREEAAVGKVPEQEEMERLDKIFYDVRLDNQSLMPGAKEALDYFDENGVRLGVISNARKRMTERRLEEFNLDHYFETVVYLSLTGTFKSSIRPYQLFLEEMNQAEAVAGDQCVMIGDDPHEDLTAAELGMQTILFDPEHNYEGSDSRDRAREPDLIIDSLSELKDKDVVAELTS